MHTLNKSVVSHAKYLAISSLPLLAHVALADDQTSGTFPPSHALNNLQAPLPNTNRRIIPNTNRVAPTQYQQPRPAPVPQYYANPYQPYAVQQPYNNGAYPMQPPMFNGMPSPMNMSSPPINYQSPPWQMSQFSPIGNTFSPTAPFANSSMIPSSPWGNSNSWFNPWKTWNTQGMPFYPGYQYQAPNKKKAWGDVRNIWPDFYTDFTEDVWDGTINAPYDMGRMPGGWRAPSLSSPDPVTVGDAITNQFPPMMEEAGNMINFAN